MNNNLISIEKIRQALEAIEMISKDPARVHVGVPASGMGIEFRFQDRKDRAHTIIFNDTAEYHKTEVWDFLKKCTTSGTAREK